MPRAKRTSAGEAAVLEVQEKPAQVARAEAQHAADVVAKPKRRRRRKTAAKAAGAPAKRRGRPKGSKNMPKPGAKRRGRPPGSKNRPKIGRPARTVRRGPGRPAKTVAPSGLGQIKAVVEGMVAERTREVLRNALAALKQATAAVEGAL
jgi:hypothetical protein